MKITDVNNIKYLVASGHKASTYPELIGEVPDFSQINSLNKELNLVTPPQITSKNIPEYVKNAVFKFNLSQSSKSIVEAPQDFYCFDDFWLISDYNKQLLEKHTKDDFEFFPARVVDNRNTVIEQSSEFEYTMEKARSPLLIFLVFFYPC